MVTRRDFLKTMSMASAGLALGTGDLLHAQTASPKKGRGDKVKIAYIGIGNRGEQIIEDFARTGMVEVVALCDVDMGAKHTQKIMAKYPKAKQFRDFRQMFDKAGNEFDAVAIATPDHSHFPISMLALASGKHVYVEKPLARTFYEAELLMQAALKRPNLVTQVGNQGHSEANYFQFKAWMDAGIIKDVTAITAHMNNPRRWHKWDTNIYKLPSGQQLPKDLDWDTWLGVTHASALLFPLFSSLASQVVHHCSASVFFPSFQITLTNLVPVTWKRFMLAVKVSSAFFTVRLSS